MKKILFMHAAALGLALGMSGQALALDLTLSAGMTSHSDTTWRAGLSSDWNRQWFASRTGHLSGYWDGGYTYWEGGNRSSGAHSLSFSPVLTYTFTGPRVQPFIEAGIGVAAFNKTRVSGRKLGVAFSFEDRLGAGIALPNNGKLGVRLLHYSNARIKRPNDGVNSWALFYRHPL